MAVIDETAISQTTTISGLGPVRTGVAIMVAGVATGSILYVLSVVVAGWA
jgi:hypothetical protein